MNPSMTRTSPTLQPPFAAVPDPPPQVAPSRSARLELLRGMLTRLLDVPPGGQHYLMDKVLPLLRREALDPGAHFQPNHCDLIMRSLDELEHEAARIAPDPDVFDRKAQILVDVLALA
jgi:hypothetical protein